MVSSVTLSKAVISVIHKRVRSTWARAVNQPLQGEAQVLTFIWLDKDFALSWGHCRR